MTTAAARVVRRATRTLASIGLVGLVGCAVAAVAEPQTPAPGQYVTEGGWGSLAVWRDPVTGTRFRIDSHGANGHGCGLAGGVTSGVGKAMNGLPMGSACTVRFDVRPGAVAVSALQHDSCRMECGARAGFEGDYLVSAPSCSDGARRRSENAFIADYRAGRYARAAATLEPLLGRCSRTLAPEEDATLRNDLAVTLFHLDRRADCRSTLAPLQNMTSEPVLTQLHDVAPTDFGTWSAIARTTRHNLSLCAEAAS